MNINQVILNTLDFTVNHSVVKPIWNKIIQLYKSKFGFDLSYMKYEFSLIPKHNDGRNSDMPNNQFGGCWTKSKIIYLNPAMSNTYKYYTNKNIKSKNELSTFVSLIISHELAHEIYNNLATEDFKNQIANEISKTHFNTDYLANIDNTKSKFKEEQFCEYLAHKIIRELSHV